MKHRLFEKNMDQPTHSRINNLRKIRKRIIRIVQYLCNNKNKNKLITNMNGQSIIGSTSNEIFEVFSQRWTLPTPETKDGTKIDLFKMAIDAEVQSGKLIALADGSIVTTDFESKKYPKTKGIKGAELGDKRFKHKFIEDKKETVPIVVVLDQKKKKGRKRKYPLPSDERDPKIMKLTTQDTQSIKEATNIDIDICDHCGLKQQANSKETDLLRCSDCESKEHPSCLSYSKELAAKALSQPWQCASCKSCQICRDTDDSLDQMLICDACDQGYHMKCHVPNILEKPNSSWLCCKCWEHNASVDQNLKSSHAIAPFSPPLSIQHIVVSVIPEQSSKKSQTIAKNLIAMSVEQSSTKNLLNEQTIIKLTDIPEVPIIKCSTEQSGLPNLHKKSTQNLFNTHDRVVTKALKPKLKGLNEQNISETIMDSKKIKALSDYQTQNTNNIAAVETVAINISISDHSKIRDDYVRSAENKLIQLKSIPPRLSNLQERNKLASDQQDSSVLNTSLNHTTNKSDVQSLVSNSGICQSYIENSDSKVKNHREDPNIYNNLYVSKEEKLVLCSDENENICDKIYDNLCPLTNNMDNIRKMSKNNSDYCNGKFDDEDNEKMCVSITNDSVEDYVRHSQKNGTMPHSSNISNGIKVGNSNKIKFNNSAEVEDSSSLDYPEKNCSNEVTVAANWSIDDVYNFFLDLGFVKEAQVFKTQEIDGPALLLLTRHDVTRCLDLKLGPALKIYTHILRLQNIVANL